MTSPESAKRRFAALNLALDERLAFSTVKISHSSSTSFDGSRMDGQRILAEFEGNEARDENECSSKASERLKEILHDDCNERAMYLFLCGASCQGSLTLRDFVHSVQFVSIPDCVEALWESCFSGCERLSRVTFGVSSSLKVICKKAFYRSGLEEIHIPDSVEELCEDCFSRCENLSRVTFGESSSLKLIGRGHSIALAWSRFIFRKVLKNFVTSAFPGARIFRALHLVSLLR